jgi:hypothetical protein
MGKIIDLTGQRFGRLVVQRIGPKTKPNQIYWICNCDCGNICEVKGGNLKSGGTKSCGCINKEILRERSIKHGFDGTPLGYVRSSMQQRCYNSTHKAYKNYGGRGITICDEWLNNSKSFFDWAIKSGYHEGLTLDRIDNDGNYCPENCRWATMKEQQNNRRNNHLYVVGDVGKTIGEWALALNISVHTLLKRLKMEWSEEKTFTTPCDKRYSRERKGKNNEKEGKKDESPH